MAKEAKVYTNDVGLVIDINMGENISSATSLSLGITKPDHTTTTWTPSIQGTNYLRYTTVANDLDQAGIYFIQPAFTLGGWTGKGNTVKFLVHAAYG